MFTHIIVGTNDLDRAQQFYDTALAPLGITKAFVDGERRVFYAGSSGRFCVSKPFDGEAASVGNGTMTSFTAPTPEAVDQFYAAGLAAGGTCAGTPGPRGGMNIHIAYLRDPDGNKISAMHMPASTN